MTITEAELIEMSNRLRACFAVMEEADAFLAREEEHFRLSVAKARAHAADPLATATVNERDWAMAAVNAANQNMEQVAGLRKRIDALMDRHREDFDLLMRVIRSK